MIYQNMYGNMYYVAYGNIFATELLIALVFFVIYQPRRNYFVFRAVLSGIFYFLFESLIWYGIVNIYEAPRYINVIFYFACTLMLAASALICFKTNLLGAVYFATGAYAVQHASYSFGNIIRYLFSVQLPRWANVLVFDFVIYVAVGVVFFLIFVFPRRRKFGFDIFDGRAFLVSLMTLILCAILSLLVDNSFAGYIETGIDVRLMRVYCGAYALIGCIASIIIQFSFLKENKIAEEKTILDQLMRSEQKRHEMSKETIEIINAKCHDLKNQIAVLGKMDDKNARKAYISELESCIAIYDTFAETGNAALNIIISEKSLICEKNKISFSYLVDGAKLSFMSSADIASMLGNAFDNAIERQLKEKEENRFISLYVKEEAGFIHVHMDNCCTGKPQFENGLPQSDKHDALNHGFGTKSISNVAGKYSGDVFMCVEDNRFNLDILFPIED